MSAVQLTSSQRKFFHHHGYLHLEQAVSRPQLRLAQRRINDELGRRGIDSAGRRLPKTISSLPVFQQIGRLSQLVNFPDLEAAVIPPDVETLVHELGNTKVMSRQSQLLLSPPRQGNWRLEGLSWHTDVSSYRARIPGIQVFVVIEDLEERGGGTLVLSGSHLHAGDARMKSRIRDAVHKGQVGEAILRELGLTIVELVGKSGDAYLMDMRTLHTPSVNTSCDYRIRHKQLEPSTLVPPVPRDLLVSGNDEVPARAGRQVADNGSCDVDATHYEPGYNCDAAPDRACACIERRPVRRQERRLLGASCVLAGGRSRGSLLPPSPRKPYSSYADAVLSYRFGLVLEVPG